MLFRPNFLAAEAVVSPMQAMALPQLSTCEARFSQARRAEGEATATTGAERAGFNISGSTSCTDTVVYVFSLVTSNPRFDSPFWISWPAFADAGYNTLQVVSVVLGSSEAKNLPIADEIKKMKKKYLTD
jgi:hypothetical protein